jgi:NAD(P) transhydrogenase subunit alpha
VNALLRPRTVSGIVPPVLIVGISSEKVGYSMKVAIPKERRPGETRVAASPESVKKMVGMGLTVSIESGAGMHAAVPDEDFQKMGAEIAKDAKSAYADADVVLKVAAPTLPGEDGVADGKDELGQIKEGAALIGMLAPYDMVGLLPRYAERKVNAFSLELLPRITRAQAMDVLSSQANLAGYKAVIEAAEVFSRTLAMMMTAAGTVPPARVFIMGAGVAGLQAIATARRLGGVVSATDVRPAAKEEVQSLGASFVAVEDEDFQQAQTEGGYAKEMSDAYKKKQAELIAETIKKQDIIICTALIPGRPAPTLVTEEMIKSMKPGAVLVDLAVDRGGNCPLSEPGKVVEKHGVKIVGYTNMPGRLPAAASLLYAKNLVSFLGLMVDQEQKTLKIDWDDEVIKGTALTRDGAVVHPRFAEGGGS